MLILVFSALSIRKTIRLTSKTTNYKNDKAFNETVFDRCENLNISLYPFHSHQCCDRIRNEFLKVVNKLAPIEKIHTR